MARRINRLGSRSSTSISAPGRHSDGGGLYLVVDKNQAKRWAFLFRWKTRLREMGLGGINSVPLATARNLAADCRAHLAAGRDPIATRRAAQSDVPSFGAFADSFVETKGAIWRNAKHRKQWAMTLTKYAEPLRAKPVDIIATEDILAVLKPLWLAKYETASRLRRRIEAVLDAASATGLRSKENPARWKGHLEKILPKRDKLDHGHHAAMPFADVPGFMEQLRGRGVAALALEFLILTAARSGEVLGARWSEIDLEAKLWTVPASRMKTRREHRVPLTDRVLAILDEAKKLRTGEFIFPGERPNRPRAAMTLQLIMARLGVEGPTPHGFRSTFRDWCGETTSFPREIAEAALAHAVGNAVELAYRRGDALEKRRKLMDAWARYCEAPTTAKVVRLHRDRA